MVRMDARHAFVAEWEGRVLCMDGCWYDCCSCKMVGVVVGAVVVVRRVVACEGLVLLGVLLRGYAIVYRCVMVCAGRGGWMSSCVVDSLRLA